MFRSIRFYTKSVFGTMGAMLHLKKVKTLEAENDEVLVDEYVKKIVGSWARNRMKDTGAKITTHGYGNLPEGQNVLFVCNHTSNLDFLIVLAELRVPISFVAKVELIKIPCISSWMKAMRCLFMDRSDMRQQLETILKGIQMLKDGKNMLIFPEGTRSKTGELGEFKAGSFKLATKAKVPIVPLTIVGAADVLENNNNKIVPGNIEFYIHKPIYLETLSKEEVGRIHQIVEEIVGAPLKKQA